MSSFPKTKALQLLFVSQLIAAPLAAQWNLNREPIHISLQHGIKQYEDGHFVQAIHSLENYLKEQPLPLEHDRQELSPDLDRDLAKYYIILSKIKYGSDDLDQAAEYYVANTVNPVHRDRVSFQLAHHYFKNENYEKAIEHYNNVDIKNLNNEEIADAKFEQAYAYFVQSDFDNAYPLFAAIKEIEDNKYYFPGNYYFGLLAYQRKEYDVALTSFRRIEDLQEYKDIIPYYIAEIHYFKGEYDQVLALADKHLNSDNKLYYDKEMHLLAGQVYFEQKKYKEALPYLEYYYKNSDKIRKENLYELAFTNYQLQHYDAAIEHFKPLSNANDSLGQNSMYLMGDAYLKTGDKLGARNAFSIASGMNYIPSIQENAQFLYAKLSYELGDDQLATQSFRTYIEQYPSGQNTTEAKEYLVTLLSNSKDYETAYEIMSDMDLNTILLQSIYQKVTFGRGMQLLRNGETREAESMLDKSLTYTSDPAVSGAAEFWKSQLLYDQKQYTASEQLALSFIEKAKSNGSEIKSISKEATLNNGYTHLGYAQMELNKYEAAQKSFAAAGNSAGTEAGAQKQTQLNALLQADAAFMGKDYDKAYQLYDEAIVKNPNEAPYAMYQKALIAGLKSNRTEKISLLQRVVKDYPNSKSATAAEYELGATYLENDQLPESKTIFEKLSKSSDKDLRYKSLSKLAFVEQKSGNIDQAIDHYETVIEEYPNHPEREATLVSLRNAYIQKGDVNGYYAFTKEKNIESSKEENMDEDYFVMAENKYIDEDYKGAVTAFDQYLSKFPNGNNKVQAQYLKGESLLAQKDYEGAKTTFNEVIQSGDEEYNSLAEMKMAVVQYELKDYNNAIRSANQYISNTSDPEAQIPAQLVLMKSYNKLKQTSEASQAASFLKQYEDQLTPQEQVEMKLSNANAAQQDKNYTEARELYKDVADAKSGSLSAEARYRIAETLLEEGKLKEAEAACDQAIKDNQGEHYWMVKSYILIGNILGAQKDFFNARATLQSVINNANNEELENEARQLLEEINSKEKSESKVVGDDE